MPKREKEKGGGEKDEGRREREEGRREREEGGRRKRKRKRRKEKKRKERKGKREGKKGGILIYKEVLRKTRKKPLRYISQVSLQQLFYNSYPKLLVV